MGDTADQNCLETRGGCEAVALGALSLVALDDDVSFAQMPEVLAGPMEVRFGIVDVLTTHMAAEYTRAQEAWVAGSVALRTHIVEDLLAGTPMPTENGCSTGACRGGVRVDSRASHRCAAGVGLPRSDHRRASASRSAWRAPPRRPRL